MWLAVLVFLFILGILFYLDTRKPPNYPPGPRWLPLLGSALDVAHLRKKTGLLAEAVSHLANKHGPVLGLRVGKDRIVAVCDFAIAKEMYSRDEFDGKPKGIFYETRTWGIRRGLLLTDEQFWQEQRRWVLRHLREFGFGRRTMAELVEAEAQHLVSFFQHRAAVNPVVPMAEIFGVYVLNTLWGMMAGKRYQEDDLELRKLQSMLTDLFASIDMVGCLFSQFPVLSVLAPELSGYNKFLYIHKQLWAFLKDELEKHKATMKPDFSRDLMDVYLKELNSEEKPSSFSELQLLAVCMDLFMAGSETTSKSISFGFMYMLLNPEVQKRAQAEIDAVIGRNRLPQLSDRPNMPYMEAIVLEAVRMFMGRGFPVPHRCLKDAELGGYIIPKDTMLIVSTRSFLMNKEFWGDPEVFRPDRFLDSGGKLNIPECYIPFGLGRHRCMGETLARSNIFVFTAALLQNFNFSHPPNKPPSTVAIDGVTPAPVPFDAVVTLRT